MRGAEFGCCWRVRDILITVLDSVELWDGSKSEVSMKRAEFGYYQRWEML